MESKFNLQQLGQHILLLHSTEIITNLIQSLNIKWSSEAL